MLSPHVSQASTVALMGRTTPLVVAEAEEGLWPTARDRPAAMVQRYINYATQTYGRS